MQELKRFTINLKSLNQDIPDTIIVGAGDANGRTLSVILTQEAAARMTPSTNLYLSWKHLNTTIEGLNVFTKVNDNPQTWEIHYPQSMLHEGNVLACLKIIDEISISTSTNFNIKILSDPNAVEDFEDNENYNIFKQAALELNNTDLLMKEQLKEYKEKFENTLKELKGLEDKLDEIIKNKIGEIPEGYTDIIAYLNASQESQNQTLKDDILNAQHEAVKQAKDYTDNALKVITY